MTDTLALARQLLGGAMINGGATVSPTGENIPTTGFLVGGAAPEWSAPENVLTASRVRQFVDLYVDRQFLGSWEDNGRIVFDVSTHHDTYSSALLAARQRGERAVFDCANQVAVFV